MKNILNALIRKIVGLIVISFLATLVYGNQSEIKEEKSPQKLSNIVLIFADGMGYGDIQKCNPASEILSPNLNSLAENGMCLKMRIQIQPIALHRGLAF